jgi:glycosyltransferase involved in cell wall biosynthesis
MRTFNEVTLLITHYNRSNSLERLLRAFEQLECKFAEIVVSDDGSQPEHLEKVYALKEQYNFTLVTTPKNKGLGNNINKGQDAVKSIYTLYVQEDFIPEPIFPENLEKSIGFLNEMPDLDMVRYYAYFAYPYMRPFRDGYSLMIFKWWYPGYTKFFYYSDHPHLRRSNFLQRFGRYKEGIKGDKTEFKMALSFLKMNGKALFYNDFTKVFIQANSEDEPSTMTTTRPQWRTSKHPLVLLTRWLYLRFRWFKNSVELLITPKIEQ